MTRDPVRAAVLVTQREALKMMREAVDLHDAQGEHRVAYCIQRVMLSLRETWRAADLAARKRSKR